MKSQGLINFVGFFQALEEARADLEKAHNLEEFKAKALLTQKQAQEEMEAEV